MNFKTTVVLVLLVGCAWSVPINEDSNDSNGDSNGKQQSKAGTTHKDATLEDKKLNETLSLPGMNKTDEKAKTGRSMMSADTPMGMSDLMKMNQMVMKTQQMMKRSTDDQTNDGMLDGETGKNGRTRRDAEKKDTAKLDDKAVGKNATKPDAEKEASNKTRRDAEKKDAAKLDDKSAAGKNATKPDAEKEASNKTRRDAEKKDAAKLDDKSAAGKNATKPDAEKEANKTRRDAENEPMDDQMEPELTEVEIVSSGRTRRAAENATKNCGSKSTMMQDPAEKTRRDAEKKNATKLDDKAAADKNMTKPDAEKDANKSRREAASESEGNDTMEPELTGEQDLSGKSRRDAEKKDAAKLDDKSAAGKNATKPDAEKEASNKTRRDAEKKDAAKLDDKSAAGKNVTKPDAEKEASNKTRRDAEETDDSEESLNGEAEPALTRRRRSDYGSSEVRLAVRNKPVAVRNVVRQPAAVRSVVRSKPKTIVREVEESYLEEEDEPILIRAAPMRRKLAKSIRVAPVAVRSSGGYGSDEVVVADEIEEVLDEGY